jgi:hypothetical protein
MTAMRPKVATNSLKIWAEPLRMCAEVENRVRPNMRCATPTPAKAPASWATT